MALAPFQTFLFIVLLGLSPAREPFWRRLAGEIPDRARLGKRSRSAFSMAENHVRTGLSAGALFRPNDIIQETSL